jgi:hypothetical protein
LLGPKAVQTHFLALRPDTKYLPPTSILCLADDLVLLHSSRLLPKLIYSVFLDVFSMAVHLTAGAGLALMTEAFSPVSSLFMKSSLPSRFLVNVLCGLYYTTNPPAPYVTSKVSLCLCTCFLFRGTTGNATLVRRGNLLSAVAYLTGALMSVTSKK